MIDIMRMSVGVDLAFCSVLFFSFFVSVVDEDGSVGSGSYSTVAALIATAQSTSDWMGFRCMLTLLVVDEPNLTPVSESITPKTAVFV